MVTLIKFAAGVKSSSVVQVDPADANAVAALAGECQWFKVADDTGYEYAYTQQFAGMASTWVWSNRYAKKAVAKAAASAPVARRSVAAGGVCRRCHSRCYGDCQE